MPLLISSIILYHSKEVLIIFDNVLAMMLLAFLSDSLSILSGSGASLL